MIFKLNSFPLVIPAFSALNIALARRVPFHAPVDSYTVGKGKRAMGKRAMGKRAMGKRAVFINAIVSPNRYKYTHQIERFAQVKKLPHLR
jgi:hypothetical protein